MSLWNWTLLVGLSVLWGGTFFFTSVAVAQIPPLTVVFLRVCIASGALLLVLWFAGSTLTKHLDAWIAFFVMGTLNNVIPFSLFFWAQTQITGGLASIANAATPAFSIVIAHFALRDEKFSGQKLFGVLFAIAGVAFLFQQDLVAGVSFATMGLVACLVAVLSQGFAVVYGRRFERLGLTSLECALGQLTATSIIMLPAVLLIDQPWSLLVPTLPAIGAILGMALFSTALAYLIFFRLLSTAGAVNTSLVTLLIPASAILLGTLFLGEVLARAHFVGLLFISVGLITIDGRLLQKLGFFQSQEQ